MIETNIARVRPYTCRLPARQLRGPAGAVGLLVGRSKRPQFAARAHRQSPEMGPLSRRETPPALFSVNRDLQVHALNVAPWTERAGNLAPAKASAEQLSRTVRELAPLNPVPSDAEAWVTLNLYHTGLQSDIPVSDSFVVALRQEYYALDWHELSLVTLSAIIRAWQVIEELGFRRGETPLLFGNAGGPLSGRSLTDPHAQAQLCARPPDLYRRLSDNGSWFRGVLAERDLEIDLAGVKNLAVLAHPAPEFNYTTLIVSRAPSERLADADPREVALALGTAIKRLVVSLGGQPAYNILARGLGAGHLHLEIVPRSTNVKGGAELAAGSATIDVDPKLARDALAANA